MPETSELRIFEADPERVVSVTVGELQEIVRSHPKTAHQFHTLAIHERTCHMAWIDRVGGVNRWLCDACGCMSVERIVSDRLHDQAPAWCHRCGAMVVGE